MIPRAAHRVETTLVSYSRISLPRTARFYSAPSKRASAPAAATATAPQSTYFPYMPMPDRLGDEISPLSNDMQGFLRRRTPYTMLPPPLPDDKSSALNDFYFTDSPTQDLLAIMDACLHNLYDVPRAKSVFERLRGARTDNPNPILHTRLYNSFLEAYIDMATEKEPGNRENWVRHVANLFQTMESGRENVNPNASTYALMLIAWRRFNYDSATPVSDVTLSNPSTILSNITDRGIKMPDVVSDRVFASSEEASDIIKLLSSAAVDMGMSSVVSELGQAKAIGSQSPDPLENVPEVMPVTRLKPFPKTTLDGAEAETSETDAELEAEIPFNLNNLRQHLAQVALARRVLPEDVASRQKLLEESVYQVAVTRQKHQLALFEDLGLNNHGLKHADLQTWMWEWHQKLKETLEVAIKDVIVMETRPLSKQPIVLGPFLSLVKPEKLSLITILELMRLQGSGGVLDGMKTARALLSVGKAVEIEYKAQMCKKNNIQIPTHARPGENTFFSRLGYRDLHARRVAARKYMEDAEEWTADWTQLLRVRVGSILVDSLMDVATVTRTGVNKRTGKEITEDQPAFFHSYEYVRGQKLGVIKLNPVIAERLAKDPLNGIMHPRHLPMLVKPKPWVSHDSGGYLFNKTAAMRFKDSQEQLSYLRHASDLGNVELVYAGLDVLGSTPWKINRKVFEVVLAVWNSGERLSKLPPAVYDGEPPEKPVNVDVDMKVKSVYLQRQKAFMQAKANNHSDRCNVNYKIEIARAFLGDTMYLPHNLDFRGRAYPIPPHLNHIGDDLSRGLLMFGEAKPLGNRGLRWLKIHLANLYGYDKGNFDERVNFVAQHLDDIYDSAVNPLKGRRWWTTADDPWQCLATCMDLHAALESPNPTDYRSSLPVHQDGTCNGLQHYAALGGDDQGARQVNLSVTDRPSDVYTFVADMVETMLEEDIKKGEKYAIVLQGKISRKVVKQTVMTTVYGVTFVGARDQIERQLKDRKDLPDELCWGASSYLARKVLICIGDLFSGAKGIQTWLNLCARLISKSIPEDRLPEAMQEHQRKNNRSTKALPANRLKKEQMTSVVWTTPMGLPIVQPYRKTKRKQITTALQTVFISDPNSPAEVNSVKQASAFPPNFIHSLDATHMMLTALECRTQGLTFASVHDSYWTHASSIDKMSEIIRDTFIALHSSDVLDKLETEFRERYRNFKVPLVHLKHGKFLKQLREAGTVIRVSPEQAAKLNGLDNILAVSETEKTPIEDLGTVDGVDVASVAEVVTKKGGRRKAEAATEDDDDDAMEVSQADTEKDAAATVALLGKFVDLVDLLPPLPKKGKFNVQDIKASQYFFS